MEEHSLERRVFLKKMTALGAAGVPVVAGLAPILVFIWPPPPAGQKTGPVTVTPSTPLSQLAENDALGFAAPQNAGFLEQDGGGANSKGGRTYGGYAVKTNGKTLYFAITCSHLGCSIAFNKGGGRFECPCHGSRFNLEGQVIHGPALYPLSHLQVKESGNDLMVYGFTDQGA